MITEYFDTKFKSLERKIDTMSEHRPRFIPRSKFCKLYDISSTTVMRWANEGHLTIRTVGSKTFVDVITFEESMINK